MRIADLLLICNPQSMRMADLFLIRNPQSMRMADLFLIRNPQSMRMADLFLIRNPQSIRRVPITHQSINPQSLKSHIINKSAIRNPQSAIQEGSERGPVALPVFKIGCSPFIRGGSVRLRGASANLAHECRRPLASTVAAQPRRWTHRIRSEVRDRESPR